MSLLLWGPDSEEEQESTTMTLNLCEARPVQTQEVALNSRLQGWNSGSRACSLTEARGQGNKSLSQEEPGTLPVSLY